MPITSIIIDNTQTTAKRVAPDKVQLDLVALPLDEQNNTEPNLGIRLYVNGQLLQDLQSGLDGRLVGSVVVSDTNSEHLTLELEDIVQGIRSKIKYVMIEAIVIPEADPEPVVVDEPPQPTVNVSLQNLYTLHKEAFSEFTLIDAYFQEIIKPENGHDEQFIRDEFNKMSVIADLKYHIKKAEDLEFYDTYKEQLTKKITYCKQEMTIYELPIILKEIQSIIKEHDARILTLRQDKKSAEDKEAQARQQIADKEKKAQEKQAERAQKKPMYIAQLKANPYVISSLEERAKDDKEIVQSVLGQEGTLLRYAGDTVKSDRESVMMALQQNTNAFSCASTILTTDEDFVFDCLHKFGEPILHQLPAYIRGVGKVKRWIDAYTTKKQDLTTRRQMIYSALQELGPLNGDIRFLQSDVQSAQKKVDAFPNLSSLLSQLKTLLQQIESSHKESQSLSRQNETIFNANSLNKKMQNVHNNLSSYESQWSAICAEIKKTPIYVDVSSLNRYYGASPLLDPNYVPNLEKQCKDGLLWAQKKLNEHTAKINAIKAKIGDVDEQELARLDQDLNQLYKTITI